MVPLFILEGTVIQLLTIYRLVSFIQICSRIGTIRHIMRCIWFILLFPFPNIYGSETFLEVSIKPLAHIFRLACTLSPTLKYLSLQAIYVIGLHLAKAVRDFSPLPRECRHHRCHLLRTSVKLVREIVVSLTRWSSWLAHRQGSAICVLRRRLLVCLAVWHLIVCVCFSISFKIV